jgi:FecR protein
MRYKTLGWLGGITLLLSLTSTQSTAQNTIQVRLERWLSLQSVSGSVTMYRGQKTQAAKVGDRLQAVGDALKTGKKSTATLTADIAIGTISLAENTYVQIKQFSKLANGAHVTRLQVTQGQARLKLRRFTNPDSRLEIQTPAGLSGVRGTEFGVTLQPNGKTGLATLTGAVESTAQGKSFTVAGGFQNFTIPGEPPSPPVPLKDDPSLDYDFEKPVINGIRKVILVGQVDAVNSVTVDGVPQVTDRTGKFRTTFPARSRLRIQVLVKTPLGREQTHEVVFQ